MTTSQNFPALVERSMAKSTLQNIAALLFMDLSLSISNQTSTTKLIGLVNSGLNKGIIVTVESIHPDDVESLGSCLDIDPFFFCGHIAPSYADIERNPLPPLLALYFIKVSPTKISKVIFLKSFLTHLFLSPNFSY
jgi:hypothetical protein